MDADIQTAGKERYLSVVLATNLQAIAVSQSQIFSLGKKRNTTLHACPSSTLAKTLLDPATACGVCARLELDTGCSKSCAILSLEEHFHLAPFISTRASAARRIALPLVSSGVRAYLRQPADVNR